MAFTFVRTMTGDGSTPKWESIPVKDTVIITIGALVNIESGEADLAATGDTALIGVAAHTVDNTNDGEYIRVSTDPDAVFAVDDANARARGALLDIAAGGLGVAAAANNDLIVVQASTATEPTYVTFNSTYYANR